jgi:hypothetical protein
LGATRVNGGEGMSRFSILTLILAWCFAICGAALVKINYTIIIILICGFVFTGAALFMVWWENKYIYGGKTNERKKNQQG